MEKRRREIGGKEEEKEREGKVEKRRGEKL